MNKYSNKSYYRSTLLLTLALIILSIGILFLIIGYSIYSLATPLYHISSTDGLITIPKISHIDIIKDSPQYII